MIRHFTTLSPDWKIPHVKAYTILSRDSDFKEVSFSHHTDLGKRCRTQLEHLVKPEQPISWLQQVHGRKVIELPAAEDVALSESGRIQADGVFTTGKRIVCSILTADCLPVVFADRAGTRVGVAHAGRKGLENGILFEMLEKLALPPVDTFVWIGPGIAAESYPVSGEIRDEVLMLSSVYESAFKEGTGNQFYMDLYAVARLQLIRAGIPEQNIGGTAWNTFTDKRFHSARRDKDLSGRMATVVWME